ncbi:hypothetical protein [Rugamonas aquatica]|uniref:Uncharacterized protein n=1 Tax=Rugamonas aquatica TaxID=2743357 RepID=A0A6A7N6F5_9BURK|nr:hypothetical protein [Rugamonas aquatica]MQA40616.1 hypothetical protein [Rugamonas aquatica]
MVSFLDSQIDASSLLWLWMESDLENLKLRNNGTIRLLCPVHGTQLAVLRPLLVDEHSSDYQHLAAHFGIACSHPLDTTHDGGNITVFARPNQSGGQRGGLCAPPSSTGGRPRCSHR